MAGGGGNVFRGGQNVQVGGNTQPQPGINNQFGVPQLQNPFGGMFAAQPQQQQPQQVQQQPQQPVQQQQGNFHPFAVPPLPNPFLSLAPNEPVTLRPEHVTLAPQFGLSSSAYGSMNGVPPLRFAEGGGTGTGYENLTYQELESKLLAKYPQNLWGTSADETYDLTLQYGMDPMYAAFYEKLPPTLKAYYTPPASGSTDPNWVYRASQARDSWLAFHGKDPFSQGTTTPLPTIPTIVTTPATTRVSTTPVSTQVSTTPATTRVSTTPVSTQVSTTPVSTQVSTTPVTTRATTPATTRIRTTVFYTEASTPRGTGQVVTFGGTVPVNTFSPPPTLAGSGALAELAKVYPYSGTIGFAPFDPSRYNFGIPWIPGDALPYAPAAPAAGQPAGMEKSLGSSLTAPPAQTSPYGGPIPIFNQAGIPALVSPFSPSAKQVSDAQRAAIIALLGGEAAAAAGAGAEAKAGSGEGGAATARAGGIVPLLKRKKSKKTKK